VYVQRSTRYCNHVLVATRVGCSSLKKYTCIVNVEGARHFVYGTHCSPIVD
jgi:hypothetical protein